MHTVEPGNNDSLNSGNSYISGQIMNDRFLLLDSEKLCNSGQFLTEKTFHYYQIRLYREGYTS